ncbi:YbdD/YjiX family protein [Streptomyces sp. E11-3]|uniref:CstA-like transporter-associated (seleno)protein n=1 Tax=Streptomyces sp. E11-3 TaxID=3110112 RepID=UPI00398121D4
MSATAAPRGALARLWWYVREFTGENAYDRYVERARHEHPDAPVLCRGEFERRRTDGHGRDPREGFRCC